MQHYTCKQDPKVYYSCSICGECERNPRHTFMFVDKEEEKRYVPGVHSFTADLATE